MRFQKIKKVWGEITLVRSECEKCNKRFIVLYEIGHTEASKPPPGELGASFGAISLLQSQPMEHCPHCGYKQGAHIEIKENDGGN